MITRDSDLAELNLVAELGGGAEALRERHAEGKLHARERLDLLFDAGSFVEIEKFRSSNDADAVLGDGLVAGYGLIDGHQVFAFADDYTVHRGNVSEATASKVIRVFDLAMSTGAPIVGLVDSEGSRLSEGLSTLTGSAEVALRSMRASGVIPMVACVMGPAVGVSSYFVALSDIVVMVEGASYLTMASPEFTSMVSHDELSGDKLGGATVHAERTGIAHRTEKSDQDALAAVREVLRYLPANNTEDPRRSPIKDDPGRRSTQLRELIPTDLAKPYNVHGVIAEVVDDGAIFELFPRFAPNMVIGFSRLAGRAIGIVANQPMHLAGTLDTKALRKASRFVRLCDAFNVPIVTFVDVPGFFPSLEQEHRGIVRAAAKLLYAYAEATVSKVTVVTRKAYGSAFVAMGPRPLRADATFAFPTAEIAVLDPNSVTAVLFSEEIEGASDPSAKHSELTAQYRREHGHAYAAAMRGVVDEVIPPEITRPRIIRILEMLHNKRQSNPPRKHGNIPL